MHSYFFENYVKSKLQLLLPAIISIKLQFRFHDLTKEVFIMCTIFVRFIDYLRWENKIN